MAKRLKSTETFKAASRPSEVSSLGIPNWSVLVGVAWVFVTIAFIHRIKIWGVSFGLLAVAYLAVKIILRRDYNAFRRLRLGLSTKFLNGDSHIWRGVAPSSFPSLPSARPRGIPRHG
jgi:type IV secretory pathway VirB3-like protein